MTQKEAVWVAVQLCIDNDEEFERLLLHAKNKGLSKGNCLKLFYSLFDIVAEFFQDSNSGSVMIYKTSRMTLLICQIYSQISIKLICSCKEMMSTLSWSYLLSPPSRLSASYSRNFISS